MPMAPANFATRRPMLPTPTIPRVLPASSVLPSLAPALRLAPQSPPRASFSSSAWPSGLIGPASTTSGRESAAIERSPFSRVRGLFPGGEDEARGVEREGRSVEPAVELDPAPALGAQHRRQLVGRVEADLALTDQLLRSLLGLGRRALEPEPAGAP